MIRSVEAHELNSAARENISRKAGIFIIEFISGLKRIDAQIRKYVVVACKTSVCGSVSGCCRIIRLRVCNIWFCRNLYSVPVCINNQCCPNCHQHSLFAYPFSRGIPMAYPSGGLQYATGQKYYFSCRITNISGRNSETVFRKLQSASVGRR